MGPWQTTRGCGRVWPGYLQLWEGGGVGHLFVVLAQLPADGPQAVEQLPPADGPRHARPGGPEVLHPAQGAAVEQHPGLAGLWTGGDAHRAVT